MKKHKAIELIIDPSSGQFSASRLCLLVIVLVYVPVLGVLEALGFKMPFWANLAMITGAVAGAYGANSFGRVWRESSSYESGPIPKAKPAPPGD